MPAGRTRFPQTMQIDMLADRSVLARDFDNFLFFEPAHGDVRPTLPTVQTGTQCDSLQLSQEMIVRPAFLVYENPALVYGLLPPQL